MNLALNHHQMNKIQDFPKLFGNQHPRRIMTYVRKLFDSEITSYIVDYNSTYALQCYLEQPIGLSANFTLKFLCIVVKYCITTLKLQKELTIINCLNWYFLILHIWVHNLDFCQHIFYT